MITRLVVLLLVSVLTGCSSSSGPDIYPDYPAPDWDTLAIVWKVPKPFNKGDFSASNVRPTFLNDSLVLFGFGEGFICLNCNTGVTRWKNQIGIMPNGYAKNWQAMDVIVEGNRIYALAGDQDISPAYGGAVCISATDGSIIWRHNFAEGEFYGRYWSKTGCSEKALFFSMQNSSVIALSKADGSQLWESPNGSFPAYAERRLDQGAPTYLDGKVYVGSGVIATVPGMAVDGLLNALDAETGKLLWSKRLPHPDSSSGFGNPQLLDWQSIVAAPLPTPDGLILMAGYCVALVDTSGQVIWERAPTIGAGASLYVWQPFLVNGNIYGINNGQGNYFAFSMNARTGALNWAIHPHWGTQTANYWTPVLDSNQIYVMTDAYEIFGQKLESGKLSFYTPTQHYTDPDNDPAAGQFAVHGNRIYYQTQNELICIQRR